MVFRDEMIDFKGELRLLLYLSGNWGEIFDLKVVKYLNESKSLKTQSFIASVDSQAVNQIDWYLRRTFTKDDINMCANLQSNWLNTIEERASYILPILIGDFLGENQEKSGDGQSPPGKTKTESALSFLVLE